jgi:hypothetical protein
MGLPCELPFLRFVVSFLRSTQAHSYGRTGICICDSIISRRCFHFLGYNAVAFPRLSTTYQFLFRRSVSALTMSAPSNRVDKNGADDRRNLYVLGLPFALTKSASFFNFFPDYLELIPKGTNSLLYSRNMAQYLTVSFLQLWITLQGVEDSW